VKCPRLQDLPAPPSGRTGWPWTSESRVVAEPDAAGPLEWPTLTIVTPSYQQGAFLEAAIRSVLLQGYPSVEYVVLDGGSTDGSAEILRKYAPWLARWRSERDQGQYAAVNEGLRSGTGTIMAWLNSDDMYLPGAFALIGTIFREHPKIDWLTSGCLASWNEHDELVSMGFARGYTRAAFFRGWTMPSPSGARARREAIQQESTFWRRTLWDRAGATIDDHLNMAGDFELWARFWLHADLATVNAPLAGFRRHGSQKTHDMAPYMNEVAEVLRRYPRPRLRAPALVAALDWLTTRTGLGRDQLASRMLRIRYDHHAGHWVCRVRREV